MMKELTKNIPDFVKNGVQGAREAILKYEKELKAGYERVSSQAPSRQDLVKRINEFQKKATDTFGKAVSTNLEKAYGVLNLPTRSEVNGISKKVNKINTEIRKLVEARGKLNGSRRAKTSSKKSGNARMTSRRSARA